jgi:Glycosyl hydrolase family 9
MGGAAILLLWADLPDAMRKGPVSSQNARCTAVKQIHYMAGDNGRGSFVAGFGENPPLRNHHRNSACARWEQIELGGKCDRVFTDVINPLGECENYDDVGTGLCYKSANRPNKFQTHGALIGGPKTPKDSGDPFRVPYSQEGWNDWRTDWIGNEQALDYNAAYTMALAGATELPQSFWTSPCPGTSDLQLDRKAGLSRTSGKEWPVGQTWSRQDFAKYGWTRTLPSNWFDRVP